MRIGGVLLNRGIKYKDSILRWHSRMGSAGAATAWGSNRGWTLGTPEYVERPQEDVEAFKTHLPSNQNSLEAREETRSPASLPCSAHINVLSSLFGGIGAQVRPGSVLCCDRSHYRSDVCYLRGDVRTDLSTSSMLLYNAPRGSAPKKRFAGEVVFVVLEYHYWWLGRYGAVLEQLTNYKVVDFRYDRRVHCFSEMIVGLRIHGELVVDPKLMPNEERIVMLLTV
ncbi:hypothetical protein ABZP36_029705 [Zizania latifolia]